jgi:nitroreductase
MPPVSSNASVPAPPEFASANARPSLRRSVVSRLSQMLRPGLARLQLWLNVRYDSWRFRKYSGAGKRDSDLAVEWARITRDYHRLEKGLALPSPRRGFGADVVKRLLKLVSTYRRRFGDGDVIDIASGAMHEHARFNGIDPAKHPALAALIATARSVDAGGTYEVTRQEVHAAARIDLSDFFARRHSVRHFDPAPVDPALIRRAIEMAQKAPSVCNRQSGRVHVLTSDAGKARALKYQNGNRGFEVIPVVLLITSDLRCFLEPSERYQAWIDGGLFAMSVNYALHSLGLGACMLNWSVDASTDAAMRMANAIPEHESIIMMMAVGHLPERFRVAQSSRRPIDEVVSFDD